MASLFFRLFGRHLLHRTVGSHLNKGGALDFKFGLALLRDRRVPLASKLLALALGIGATVLLISLQWPLELFLAAMLPLLGIAGDVALDGLEAVAGPLLIGALLLPHLAPPAIVQSIRDETPGQRTFNG